MGCGLLPRKLMFCSSSYILSWYGGVSERLVGGGACGMGCGLLPGKLIFCTSSYISPWCGRGSERSVV